MVVHVYPGLSVSPECLLPGSHAIKTFGRDLKDLYFILKTDAARWPMQTWGPRVSAKWFQNLDSLEADEDDPEGDWWEADLASINSGAPGIAIPLGFVQPQACTLVMGD